MSGTEKAKTARTQIRRHPERGAYDRSAIDAILDEGFLCHVAYEATAGPIVLPTLYGRLDDHVYFHGSPAAGMFRRANPDADVCLTVTLVDGYVLARSLFHHSMNYRSVAVFGRAEEVVEPSEIMGGLEAITENVLPGRWGEARLPNEVELRQTTVFRVLLAEASVKMRSGDPGDEEEDLALDIWAGVIPVKTTVGEPVAAPNLKTGVGLTTAFDRL